MAGEAESTESQSILPTNQPKQEVRVTRGGLSRVGLLNRETGNSGEANLNRLLKRIDALFSGSIQSIQNEVAEAVSQKATKKVGVLGSIRQHDWTDHEHLSGDVDFEHVVYLETKGTGHGIPREISVGIRAEGEPERQTILELILNKQGVEARQLALIWYSYSPATLSHLSEGRRPALEQFLKDHFLIYGGKLELPHSIWANFQPRESTIPSRELIGAFRHTFSSKERAKEMNPAASSIRIVLGEKPMVIIGQTFQFSACPGSHEAFGPFHLESSYVYDPTTDTFHRLYPNDGKKWYLQVNEAIGQARQSQVKDYKALLNNKELERLLVEFQNIHRQWETYQETHSYFDKEESFSESINRKLEWVRNEKPYRDMRDRIYELQKGSDPGIDRIPQEVRDVWLQNGGPEKTMRQNPLVLDKGMKADEFLNLIQDILALDPTMREGLSSDT